MSDFYTIPLKLGDIIEKNEHTRCSLGESVAMMCQLISTSQFGEFKHDDSFGCEIWEHDFENIVNTQLYKDQLKKSIRETIEIHEPRLSDVMVDIQIEQIEEERIMGYLDWVPFAFLILTIKDIIQGKRVSISPIIEF